MDVNRCLRDISDLYIARKIEWKSKRERFRQQEDLVKRAFDTTDVSFQYSCALLVAELSKVFYSMHRPDASSHQLVP